MRYLILIILPALFLLGGCAIRRSAEQPSTFQGLLNPMTEHEVSAMKKRLEHLRIGMTVEECFDTLHFDTRRMYGGDVQDSKTRRVMTFGLHEEHNLVLLWDITSGSPRLLSAGIDEKVWPLLKPEGNK